MNIESLNGLNSLQKASTGNEVKNSDTDFAAMLRKATEDLNATQAEAYKTMEAIATGKVENLQEAVMKLEEADLSLKLGLEVKNKALSAYKDIMRMQV